MSRSNARIVRFAVFAAILIVCGFILSKGSSYTAGSIGQTDKAAANGAIPVDGAAPASGAAPAVGAAAAAAAAPIAKAADAVKGAAAAAVGGEKISATFVSLARNSDIDSLLGSIRQVEDRFNKNFHYDWVFLNDELFSEEFKEITSAACSGKTQYGLIPKEQWSYPNHIDQEKAALAREKMVQEQVIYGGSVLYRHMCRYESGFFWRHELMMPYDYYWRVEPDIKIYCDIDYDIFKWMQDNDKAYAFTISLPEYDKTIPTLWLETKKFMEANPQYLAENNMLDWISNDKGETYNGCHFWSNFEIASLKFWRSEAYTKYFEHLDQAGGFFYERWGDAPVHSIAASLFLNRDKVHFFEDVGYYHVPFHNCPVSKATRLAKNCVCNPNEDFTWRPHSCTTRYYSLKNLKRPEGWENFTS